MGLMDHTDHGISMIENREHVSDEEKENKSGNLYYKTLNGGVIRSVRPPNKGGVKYKVGECWLLYVRFYLKKKYLGYPLILFEFSMNSFLHQFLVQNHSHMRHYHL